MDFTKEVLGFWKGLTDFIQKQGYWRMTKVVLFIGFAIGFFYTMKNFGESFRADLVFGQKEAVAEAIAENEMLKFNEHADEMLMREEIKPKITRILTETLHSQLADRAFIIELHNGSNNTAGLPFIHCTMTYEVDAKGIEPIDEDYQNLSLSRFDFPEYLHTHDLWAGSVEEFAEIDKKVSNRMKSNGATYIVITTIRSDSRELGYFGFTYCDGRMPKDNKEMMSHLISTVQSISKLLDKNIEGEND